MTLDCDTWLSPDSSGQRLMILTAEPRSPSHDALQILLSWNSHEHMVVSTDDQHQ